MIEVHNLKGTKSYGCFANLKVARNNLNVLKKEGKLDGENDTVTVCSFRNRTLQRVYNVRLLRGKWRMLPTFTPHPTPAA